MGQHDNMYLKSFGPHRSGAPSVPDRALEFIWFGLAGIGVTVAAILAVYVCIELEMPTAAWSLLPMALFSCFFIWPAMRARSVRQKAEIEFVRYQEGSKRTNLEL
jgi:hypothetical protein